MAGEFLPGSNKRINPVSGVSTIILFTEAELASYGSSVYPAGLLLRDETGNLYMADGVTALNALTPIVDTTQKPLTPQQHQALDLTFSGDDGNYKATEGGFPVLGAAGADGNPKLADAVLNLVDADGHLVGKYLQTILTDENGIILLNKLPARMRAHMTFVKKYADIAGLEDEKKHNIIFVVDASDDPSGTVTRGWAMYAFNVDEGGQPTGDPIKISEGEGFDFDWDAIAANYENVRKAGAVMYDHPVLLVAPTLTQFDALYKAYQSAPKVEVFTAPAKYRAGAGKELPLKISLVGTKAEAINVTITATGCQVKEASGGAQATLTKNDTIANVNTWLEGVSVVVGSTNGSVEISCADFGQSTTITVEAIGADADEGDEEEPPAPLTTELTTKPANYTGNTGAEVACGLALSGTETGQIALTLTGTNCQLKDGEGEPAPSVTKTDTMVNLNAWLSNVKVVIGSEAGTVTIHCDKIVEDTTLDVTVTPAG